MKQESVPKGYETRFIKMCEVTELISLWHTSHVPCTNRHDRMLKTVEWFAKWHPEYTHTAVYKDLDGLLEGY